MRENEQKL